MRSWRKSHENFWWDVIELARLSEANVVGVVTTNLDFLLDDFMLFSWN
jgi:hypothetical protein